MYWSFVNDQIDSGHTHDAERGVNCLWPVTTRIQTDNDTRPTCHRLFCFGGCHTKQKIRFKRMCFRFEPHSHYAKPIGRTWVSAMPISGCVSSSSSYDDSNKLLKGGGGLRHSAHRCSVT
jgi:hypothetical protein